MSKTLQSTTRKTEGINKSKGPHNAFSKSGILFIEKAHKHLRLKIVYLRKIILLLSEYHKKFTRKNIKHKDKLITTIPDLGQAHKTCGWVKLV